MTAFSARATCLGWINLLQRRWQQYAYRSTLAQTILPWIEQSPLSANRRAEQGLMSVLLGFKMETLQPSWATQLPVAKRAAKPSRGKRSHPYYRDPHR
jgi:hypothetical protein